MGVKYSTFSAENKCGLTGKDAGSSLKKRAGVLHFEWIISTLLIDTLSDVRKFIGRSFFLCYGQLWNTLGRILSN